ncbi:hypothetical protein X875_18450 [Mannheimia varigena USDA-ARS-USMARC-1388]|nr:hypothetical protein X875_18450 [Mannheimia varigena USDA-ARS-USMARC-1388]
MQQMQKSEVEFHLMLLILKVVVIFPPKFSYLSSFIYGYGF